MKKSNRGFTLIELLVVISIIGLLSSVVLASLNTARAKARDASAKQLAREYRTLMELEISDTSTGTHAALNNAASTGTGKDSWATFAWCGNPSSVKYGDKAEEICNALVDLKAPAPGNGYLYVNSVSTGIYRIIVGLSSGRYFCLNGKGQANEYTPLADPDGAGPLTPWSYTSAGACSDL